MKIAVVGLWHLGTVTAACLAEAGYDVIGFDDNPEIVGNLQRGRLPVFEPGLEDLTRRACQAGKLVLTSDPNVLSEAEIVWIAYDTPIDEDDHGDAEYVIQKVVSLLPYVTPGALLLISSQLPVGSTRRLEEICRRDRPGEALTCAYLPENLRLGRAIETFARAERIVVGVRTHKEKDRIEGILRPFTKRIEWMSVESAEMAKHALNAFLATSVAFINELSRLCERTGADAREVERALKTDGRIGPGAYLRPGNAFSGGTLGRDVRFLVDIGRREKISTYLWSAVLLSNDAHRQWPWHRLVEVLGDLRGRTIGVLGLTYKPGTDTLRQSSAIETCRWLHRQGAVVAAYDPAVKRLPEELAKEIDLRSSVEGALRGAEAVLVATEWPDFVSVRADDLLRWMAQPIVLDPGGFLEKNLAADKRIRYLVVGKVA